MGGAGVFFGSGDEVEGRWTCGEIRETDRQQN